MSATHDPAGRASEAGAQAGTSSAGGHGISPLRVREDGR
jgi:hypothetical protein